MTWNELYNSILVDLQFIAGIKQGEKPCFSERIYVNSDSYFGSAYRFYKRESGNDAQQRIRAIFQSAMNHFVSCSEPHQPEILIHDIKNALVGLNNLINTYAHNPNIHSRLAVIKKEVEVWLADRDTTLPSSIPISIPVLATKRTVSHSLPNDKIHTVADTPGTV